ncbi:hypothetical protein NML43_15205 [Rhodopseudomonas palustris]|uniref:hypothetical protein n=1 Tax=Rhodopseudomonas palustris TaxID=1076 RepID=UPI0020CFC587|nr:hypothetical protein [Rhodopseudomonas palustris]MCP9628440.1 hypothetical protein [Rhodopseudomonas palustris]
MEQRLLRDTFGQVREYLNFPSRKARQSRRWSGTRLVTDKRTGDCLERPLADGIIGLYLAFPDYLPRALSAEPPDEKHKTRSLAFIRLNDIERPIPQHLEDCWISFNANDIERCIAKIALGEAIRQVDQDIRDPILSKFILDGEGDSSEFLGASPTHEISNNMHRIFHHKLVKEGSDVWLMTTVELFSFLPSPSYKVLIRPSGSTAFASKRD